MAHGSSLKMTSFKVVYGMDPPMVTHYRVPTMSVHNLDTMLRDWDLMLDAIKTHLACGQACMKTTEDKH